MSEKEIRGAVIGVTDDGYPIVTEDYSCPYFTGTSRSMPAVRECWYCRYADFRKSTKLPVSYTHLDVYKRQGMFLWVTLPEGVSALSLFPKALEKKVAFVPGDPFYINMTDTNTMRLNFTNADCSMIDEGIRRLGELLREI